jgi:transcriptional regulator with XRE-family HTH domain
MVKRAQKPPPRRWRKIFLREWREHRGLSVEKLATLSGVSPGQISVLENGKAGYSSESLEKLAKALDCEPGDILSTNPKAGGALIRAFRGASDSERLQIEAVIRAILEHKPRQDQ